MGGSALPGGSITNPVNTAYVPWDLNFLYDGVAILWNNIGSAFNVGIWIFIIITGIYLALKIVNNIGK